jgi:hypothetical protein
VEGDENSPFEMAFADGGKLDQWLGRSLRLMRGQARTSQTFRAPPRIP